MNYVIFKIYLINKKRKYGQQYDSKKQKMIM